MKKKSPTKRESGARGRLFPRRINVPARVQASSELWLEMFMGFCDGILMLGSDNEESSRVNSLLDARHLTEQARALADAALHQFEDRWPEVKL